MNETELGFLGSIVYLGIVLMGLFAGRLYQRINSKVLTLGALIALQVSLALFILSANKGLAYFCRFLTGVCQVFLLVYYPIWIDKFGFKKKTLWLTLLQICVPVGIFAGYGMTSLVISFGFSVNFLFNSVQSFILFTNRYGGTFYHRVRFTIKNKARQQKKTE